MRFGLFKEPITRREKVLWLILLLAVCLGAALPDWTQSTVTVGCGADCTIQSTTPTAAASAQAGKSLTIKAGSATAGTTNAGAAAGGYVYLTAGNSARLTNGNADGGDVVSTGGNGIGDGDGGSVKLQGGTESGAGTAGGIVANGAITASDRAGAGAGTITTVAGQNLTIPASGAGTLVITRDTTNNGTLTLSNAAGTGDGTLTAIANKRLLLKGQTGTYLTNGWGVGIQDATNPARVISMGWLSDINAGNGGFCISARIEGSTFEPVRTWGWGINRCSFATGQVAVVGDGTTGDGKYGGSLEVGDCAVIHGDCGNFQPMSLQIYGEHDGNVGIVVKQYSGTHSGDALQLRSSGGAIANIIGKIDKDFRYWGNVTGDITGNADTATEATNVTAANEATDTTCFPLFATAATGTASPKTNAALTFNSSTAVLGVTGVTTASTRINTVDCQVLASGSTEPTTRADGTALVAGDRFYEVSTGLDWVWDGTYWLSAAEYSTSTGYYQNSGAFNEMKSFVRSESFDVYVTGIQAQVYVLTTNNASHYWTITANKVASNDAETAVATCDTSAVAADGRRLLYAAATSFVDMTTYNGCSVRWAVGAGAPGNIYITVSVAYRLVHR